MHALVPDLNKERPYAIPLVRPLSIPHLSDWRKMQVCLINFNKGEDDEGVFKILQYFEIECNYVRKITEGLFRKYISAKVQNSAKKIIQLSRSPPIA